MLKATSGALEKLGITNCYASFGTENAETRLCALAEISRHSPWKARFDKDFTDDKLFLNMAVYRNAVRLPVHVIERKDGEVSFSFDEETAPFQFKDLLFRVADMEASADFRERRRDRRYPVGVDGCAGFGLDPSRMKVFHKNSESPFMFMDASFSGAKIVVELGIREIAVGDIMVVRAAFVSPVEQVAVKAVARMVDVKADAGGSRKRLAIVGLELLDPPLSWTDRLEAYITKLEG